MILAFSVVFVIIWKIEVFLYLRYFKREPVIQNM
jgi:hypothetical protein